MMSRKAIASMGKKAAKKNGKPAIKFAAGLRIPSAEPSGTGTGYLDKGVKKIKQAKNTRQQAIDEIMKDL